MIPTQPGAAGRDDFGQSGIRQRQRQPLRVPWTVEIQKLPAAALKEEVATMLQWLAAPTMARASQRVRPMGLASPAVIC